MLASVSEEGSAEQPAKKQELARTERHKAGQEGWPKGPLSMEEASLWPQRNAARLLDPDMDPTTFDLRMKNFQEI